MTEREYRVHVPVGELAVRSVGDRGPAVLFVHSVCNFAAQWSLVAWELSDRARCYMLDSRGHGSSEAEYVNTREIWHDVVATAEQLGLEGAIVVAEELACSEMKMVLHQRPELFSGAIFINPASDVQVADNIQQIVDDFLEIMETPALMERAGLGAKGKTPEELEAYLDRMAAAAEGDWMFTSLSSQYREFLRSAVRVYPDGSWERRPRLEDLLQSTKDSLPDLADYSENVKLPESLPVWYIESTFEDPNTEQPFTLPTSVGYELRRSISLPAKMHPECTHPQEIADIIMQMHASIQARRRSGSSSAT